MDSGRKGELKQLAGDEPLFCLGRVGLKRELHNQLGVVTACRKLLKTLSCKSLGRKRGYSVVY
jgi:hypothetical protein